MLRKPIEMMRWTARFLLLLLLHATVSASDGLKGGIRFEPAREGPAWVGQEVELNLELWSDGFSFGNQLFILPEVRGGYLLQADSGTVKLSENRDGVQWQGLRYTLLLYPQRAGRLEVPSFDVQFTASTGYGSPAAGFSFQTPVIEIEARLPPGAARGALLVSTSDFSMQASWTPAAPDEGPAELRVGDSLTLKVIRRAQDVPGMVFSPLPRFSIDGLAEYPASPEVNDEVNRGSLTGNRTDSVTFICEREGRYTIPELRFQWWDPAREKLAEKVIGSLEVQVAANPAFAPGPQSAVQAAWRPDWKVLLAGMVLLLLAAWLGWRVLRLARNPDQARMVLGRMKTFVTGIYRKVVPLPVELPPLNPVEIKSR